MYRLCLYDDQYYTKVIHVTDLVIKSQLIIIITGII